MTYPLKRLSEWQFTAPGPGQISLAVARHEAPAWPSPEVYAYAGHRSELLHQLVDETGAPVVSWGNTDGEHPQEVVEIVLAIAMIVVPAAVTLITAWIARPRKTKDKTTEQPAPERPAPPPDTDVLLPGIAMKRHDGTELRITYRDNLSNKEILRLVETFLEGAVEQAPVSGH